jgi:hypothetical protein
LDTGHDQPLTPVGVWAPECGQALQPFKDIEIKLKGRGPDFLFCFFPE